MVQHIKLSNIKLLFFLSLTLVLVSYCLIGEVRKINIFIYHHGENSTTNLKMITHKYHIQLIGITGVSNYAKLSQQQSSQRILREKIVGAKDDLKAG